MTRREDEPSPIHALGGQRAAHRAETTATGVSMYRQNDVGDVVIPVEHGEIVALPRLWNFSLDVVGSHGAVLRGSDGLTATVRFSEETVVVDHVAEATGARSSAREVA